MSRRCLVVLLALMSVMLLGPATAAVQAQTADTEKWTAPSTPWGDPDIQGTFTFRTITPLERPSALAGKETLDPDEAENFEASENIRRNVDLLDPPSQSRADIRPNGERRLSLSKDERRIHVLAKQYSERFWGS